MPRFKRAITTTPATTKSRKIFPSRRYCAAWDGETAISGTCRTRHKTHPASVAANAAIGHQCHCRNATTRAAAARAWPRMPAVSEIGGEYE